MVLVFALLAPAGQTLARFTDGLVLTDKSIATGELSIEAVPNSMQAELRSYQNAPQSRTRTFGSDVTCSSGSGEVFHICHFNHNQMSALLMSGGDEVRVSQRFTVQGEGKNLRARLDLSLDPSGLPDAVNLSDINLYVAKGNGDPDDQVVSIPATSPKTTVENIAVNESYILTYTLDTFDTRCPKTGDCTYPGASGTLPSVHVTVVQEDR